MEKNIDKNKENYEIEDDMEYCKLKEKKFQKKLKKRWKRKKISKYNYNNNNDHEIRENDEILTKPQKKSEFSLEGVKYPLSIYTRRVIDISNN